jgi:hypothetical protein
MAITPLTHHFLDVDSSGVGLYLGVNGVQLLVDPKGDGIRTLLPVNEWIMPGENKLTATLNWPAHQDFKPNTAAVKLSLFESDPESEFPDPLKVLAEATWPAPPPEREQYPHKISVPFEVSSPPPASLWEQAEEIDEVTDEAKDIMLEKIETLRTAIMAGNHDLILRLLDYRYAEDARVNGIDPEKLKNSVKRQYEMLLDEPNVSSSPLEKENASFLLAVKNKVVKVVGLNSKDAIVITTEEAEYEIQAYLAKIGGEWIFVR